MDSVKIMHIDWEKIEVDPPVKRRLFNEIKAYNSNGIYTNVRIATNLINKVGWTDGTRVDLYKAEGMFMLKENKAGLITIRSNNAGGYVIHGRQFCMSIGAKKHDGEFKAWTSGNSIIFQPKENE